MARLPGVSRMTSVLTLLLSSSVLFSAPATAWVVRVDGALNGFDAGHAVAFDLVGNPILAGPVRNVENQFDFTVIKLSKVDGTELWRTSISSGVAFSIAVDSVGDVFAVGTIGGALAVVKLSGATGNQVWHALATGSAGGGTAFAAVVNDSDDVIVAGYLRNVVTGSNFAVIKLAGATGAEFWRRTIVGNPDSSDRAMSLAVDSEGDVVAGGETFVGSKHEFTVAKVSGATGEVVWRTEVFSDGGSVANAVAFDAAGDVIAAGRTFHNESGMDFAVVKLSGATGGELWRRDVDGGANREDYATSMVVDSTGDVTAAGKITQPNPGSEQNAVMQRFGVIKFSGATGAEVWRRVLDGRQTGYVAALSIDVAGNPIAAGRVATRGKDGGDFTVMKLNAADGSVVWRRSVHGRTSYYDEVALAVAADSSGNVVATGQTFDPDTYVDFTTLYVSGGGRKSAIQPPQP
jgi:hypothetical protein